MKFLMLFFVLSQSLVAEDFKDTHWSYELKYLNTQMFKTGFIDFTETKMSISTDGGTTFTYSYHVDGDLLFIDDLGFYIKQNLESCELTPASDVAESYRITMKKVKK